MQVALERIKILDKENKDIDSAYKRNIDAIRNPSTVKKEVGKKVSYEEQKPLKVYREQLKKMEDRDKKGIFG